MVSIPYSRHKGECFAELLGTYLLVLIGPASVIVTASLIPNLTPAEALFIIGLAFGGAVAAAILLLGRFSGAHINPAITIAHTLMGVLHRKLFVLYILSQLIGGALAGLTLRLVFAPVDKTMNLGSTELANGINPAEGVFLEAAGTFVLSIAALLASSYVRASVKQAFLVGTTLFSLILVLGPLTGASLNPARSFGPSLASGYFSNQYVYWIGPCLGAFLAALTFRAIGNDERRGRILFVCVENAGRSQMAEAFAKKHGLDASSAGTAPASRVNPVVVEVMREKGVDISSSTPRMLTMEMIEKADLVVTMGCSVEEVCPRPMILRMQKKLEDWALEDPKGKPVEQVRRIRDEVEKKVMRLESIWRKSASRKS